MRSLYVFLLALHPAPFRTRFAEEMLTIYDQVAVSGRTGALMIDALRSLARQWALRPESRNVQTASHAFDGAPVFSLVGNDVPRAGALLNGAIVAIAAFAAISLLIRLGGGHPGLPMGSHHVSRSHLLGVQSNAIPTTDLEAEVKVKPEPEEVPEPAYFRIVLVLRALDTDRDGVISAAEISNAPSAIARLDRNHDGWLSAEECGAHFGYSATRPDAKLVKLAEFAFMRFHPVTAALDANHDGKISASEIANASEALRTLDRNGDGMLTKEEFLPPAQARRGR